MCRGGGQAWGAGCLPGPHATRLESETCKLELAILVLQLQQQLQGHLCDPGFLAGPSSALIQNCEQPCETRGDSGTDGGPFPSLRNLPLGSLTHVRDDHT